MILISPTDVASEPQFTEGKHGYSEHLEKNLARSVVNADLDGETEILPSLSKVTLTVQYIALLGMVLDSGYPFFLIMLVRMVQIFSITSGAYKLTSF